MYMIYWPMYHLFQPALHRAPEGAPIRANGPRYRFGRCVANSCFPSNPVHLEKGRMAVSEAKRIKLVEPLIKNDEVSRYHGSFLRWSRSIPENLGTYREDRTSRKIYHEYSCFHGFPPKPRVAFPCEPQDTPGPKHRPRHQRWQSGVRCCMESRTLLGMC